ncbi:hypothetical protein L249_4442 [Ophiocordyceps polyrhachis-furcata BCC 54312]|uniref:Sensitive to high expression protein 9, mitochondrial n=1 Tax=Ophiocordyceps polyrhachis-furcata BCC 54312 TaxID=1330021 RepID=A0A367L8T8_9HYPO|nr:hypothetical protein L249_4442 [Ophiocordyceps polyrhachis-furcata BCC 54312]
MYAAGKPAWLVWQAHGGRSQTQFSMVKRRRALEPIAKCLSRIRRELLYVAQVVAVLETGDQSGGRLKQKHLQRSLRVSCGPLRRTTPTLASSAATSDGRSLELHLPSMPPFGRVVVRTAWSPIWQGASTWLPRTRLSYTSQPSSPSPADAKNNSEAAESELPSAKDHRRSTLNRKLSNVMDDLQSRVLTASHTLNDITGYSAIEAIKMDNQNLEDRLAKAQEQVRTARQAYRSSNTKRSATQREVTTLLARKDSWLPVDLERFTELYRTDHVLEGEVTAAQEALTEAEADEQRLSQRLNAGILKRYHEEQIWSDRIRRASTWGTWGLMGMNFVLFVVLQFVAEPWRRRRLVRGVVEEERGVLQEVRDELGAVKLSMADMHRTVVESEREAVPTLMTAPTPPARELAAPTFSWREILLQPTWWRAAMADLGSDRRVDLRMRDASIMVFEGALAGAAIAGSLAMALTWRS